MRAGFDYLFDIAAEELRPYQLHRQSVRAGTFFRNEGALFGPEQNCHRRSYTQRRAIAGRKDLTDWCSHSMILPFDPSHTALDLVRIAEKLGDKPGTSGWHLTFESGIGIPR